MRPGWQLGYLSNGDIPNSIAMSITMSQGWNIGSMIVDEAIPESTATMLHDICRLGVFSENRDMIIFYG